MKNSSIKKHFLWIILLVFLLILACVLFGHSMRSSSETQAESALITLLSCTQEQAASIDAALTPQISAESEPGISSGDDRLEVLLTEQYSPYMTDICIQKLLQNRTFYKSVSLAKKHTSDIILSELSLSQRSGSADVYNIRAVLKDSNSQQVAAVSGSISMQKDGSIWKASDITLTIK